MINNGKGEKLFSSVIKFLVWMKQNYKRAGKIKMSLRVVLRNLLRVPKKVLYRFCFIV
jgi:hypothetical protein